MTKDEIKQSISMTEVLERYGLHPNQEGFIRCPFHKEKTASMKIYKDSFYCFGCGSGGDIFKFVMLMDGISFKDAFISLGGEYQKAETKKEAWHRSRDLEIAKRKRERKEKEQKELLERLKAINKDIDFYRSIMQAWKPLTDEWCDCMAEFQSLLFEYEYIWEEVKDIIK